MYVEDTPDYRDPRSCAEQRRGVCCVLCQPLPTYGVWRLASCLRAFKSLCMQHLLAEMKLYRTHPYCPKQRTLLHRHHLKI
jgi:hypothetical protein